MQHDPHLLDRARQLRRSMTPAETILWRQLRGRSFAGFKFRRQHPIGPFIADYYCANCALVLEFDGESHLGREQEDQGRQQYLESQGLKVLRFWNNEVYENLNVVLEVIYQECRQRKKAHPSPPTPLPGGERGEEEA